MKKLFKMFMVSLFIILFATSNICALNKTNELETKEYMKEIKTYIKKDKFDTLEEYPNILHPVKLHKVEKVGVDYGYIEPMLKQIEENKKKSKSLISFLENNKTNDKEFNILIEDMLSTLKDIDENLDKLYKAYKRQYKVDIPDDEKVSNLDSRSRYFIKKESSAYDYLARYNNRVEKMNKIYNQMKKLWYFIKINKELPSYNATPCLYFYIKIIVLNNSQSIFYFRERF